MSWVGWIFAATGIGILYQTMLKLSSNKLPMWGYLFVGGVGLVALALGMFWQEASPTKWAWASPRNLVLLGVAGLSLVLLEMAIFKMYQSGAPIALARASTGAMGMVGLLLIGTFFFKETLTIQQLAGIFIAVAGIMLMTVKV